MITYSTLFYFILPVGLVLAGALAAYLQGVHFRRRNRLRELEKQAADQGASQKKRSNRVLPVGALIGCSFVLTTTIMAIVEHTFDDRDLRSYALQVEPLLKNGGDALTLSADFGRAQLPNDPVYIITAVREDRLLQLTGGAPLSPSALLLSQKLHDLGQDVSELKEDLRNSKALQ